MEYSIGQYINTKPYGRSLIVGVVKYDIISYAGSRHMFTEYVVLPDSKKEIERRDNGIPQKYAVMTDDIID